MTSDTPDQPPTPTAAAPTSRLRRWIRGTTLNLLLLATSAAFAAGLAEVTVRLILPQQLIVRRPDIWRADDGLGWTLQPGVATRINTGEGEVSLFTDARGFRIAQGGRRPDATALVVFGDSFMEALQVEYEQSTPALLDSILSRRLGQAVESWNTGVGGWEPSQYLIQAGRLPSDRDFAAAVTFLYLGNDVVNRRTMHFPPRLATEVHPLRWPRRWSRREVIDAWFYPVNDALETRSHAFILVKTKLQTVLMRAGLTATYFPEEFKREVAGSARWDTTAAIVADLQRALESRGTPMVTVLIPAPFQVDTAVFAQFVRGFELDPAGIDIDQPSTLLGSALARQGVAAFDATPLMRAAAAREPLFGRVDQHLTVAGHRVLADTVAGLVAGRLSERRPRRDTAPPSARR